MYLYEAALNMQFVFLRFDPTVGYDTFDVEREGIVMLEDLRLRVLVCGSSSGGSSSSDGSRSSGTSSSGGSGSGDGSRSSGTSSSGSSCSYSTREEVLVLGNM